MWRTDGFLALSADGRRALRRVKNRSLRLWDLESGKHLRDLTVIACDCVTAVALSGDGQRALAVILDADRPVFNEEYVAAWDLESGEPLRGLTVWTTSYGVTAVALSGDGRRALSVGESREDYSGRYKERESLGRSASDFFKAQPLGLWDLDSGRCLRTLNGHTDVVESMALSADGRRAVSGSKDRTLRLWDLDTGQCLRTLEGFVSPVTAVALSADGRLALSGSKDGTLRLWDLESAQCLHTLAGFAGPIIAVALSADGRCAVSGSDDYTLRWWDLETGQCLRTLAGDTWAQ